VINQFIVKNYENIGGRLSVNQQAKRWKHPPVGGCEFVNLKTQ